MKRILLLWSACMMFGATLHAQSEYYRQVEGLKQAELKTALHELIQPEKVLGYGGKGEGYTWAGFVQTDCTEDGYVLDRYSNTLRKFNGLNAVEGMNIEHSFANSWWGHTVNNAYCDLFNLYPSDGTANGRKSNNPIGVVTETPVFDNGVTRVGKSASYRADSLITVWEPADEWKGDFARAYFYMATCYEDYTELWQTTEGLLMVEKNRYPTLRSWVSSLLLQWNEADPVDEIERARNEAVYGIQGNRNPYVDYPQLATYIWGDSIDYAFYTDKYVTAPELFVPLEGNVVDYGLQALGRGLSGELTVRGRNMAGGLTLSVDNPEFVLGRTELTADEVLQGVTLNVNCMASQPGVHEALLTLSGPDFAQTNTLRVDYVDGIPAYPAKDLVCAVASKRFMASWMAMGDGLTYTVDVYTKNKSGEPVSVSGYPKETMDTSLRVEGLKASTTYYYKVSLPESEGQAAMTSNEVKVEMPAVTPVFSVGVGEMSFVTIPGRPSSAQALTITALEVPKYTSTVSVDAPFEVSSDGEEWTTELILTGSSQNFLIRLGEIEGEGNVEGEMIISTEGVDDIVVSLSGEADRQKSFYETFEIGSKGAYAEGTVACAATTWKMTEAMMGNLAADKKNGTKSVRMRKSAVLEMTEDKVGGCDSLSFYAGMYGSDSGANVQLAVSYSLDGGQTWTPACSALSFTKGEWKRYVYYLHVDGLVRLRFEWPNTSNSKRLNIDDVQMSDFNTDEGDGLRSLSVSSDDEVKVYTLDGILVRTAKRKDALKGLKPEYYIVK